MSILKILYISEFKKRYMQLPRSVQAAFGFTLCNFLVKGINFLSAPLFTRLLSEKEYGTLSLFSSYEQIILILATWEIQTGAYQKGIFKYKSDINLFTTTTQFLISCIATAFFVMTGLLLKKIREFMGFTPIVWIIMYVYMVIKPSYDSWLVKERTYYHYKLPIIITLIYSIGNVGIPILIMRWIAPTANVKFISTLIIGIFIGLFFYIPKADYLKLLYAKEKVKEFCIFNIRFQGPSALHSISYLILAQADRIMIGKYIGDIEVAYYSVAYGLASIVSIFQISLIQSLRPWFYRTIEEREYGKIQKVTFSLLLVIGVISLFFLTVAPEAMRILFPKTYYEAVWCIPPISAGIFFVFLYSLFVMFEEYYEKTNYVMYVSVLCAGINVILNFSGIKLFGYIACAYTTCISYILFAVGHFIFMEKVRKQKTPDEYPFDIRAFFVVGVLVCFFSLGITILYPYPRIRYGVLLIGLIALLTQRRHIIELIMQLKK